jgi:predicted MFS family arabinose efflux permease
MLAFAVASVVGVPLGIALGTRIGWQAPFFALAALGLPLVGLAAWSLPPLAAHVAGSSTASARCPCFVASCLCRPG